MTPPRDIISLVIFGARSYTAGELLRLLASHPRIKPAFLVSKSAEGACIEDLQPHVAGCFQNVSSGDEAAAFAFMREQPAAAVVFCVSNGECAPVVTRMDEAGLLGSRAVVDLSGDFRLGRAQDYPVWYERAHEAPKMLPRFDYCIPELHRDEARSKLVSNPGCFATAVQFACAPALRAGLVEADLRVFAVTGSSGSGATPKPNTHHPFRAHEFYAYKPLEHQHLPEIRRGLALDDGVELALVTHSAPIVRGISVTAMFKLKAGAQGDAFKHAYVELCEREPMLDFVNGQPTLGGIIGTNRVRLGVAVEGRKAVAFCAIDNLTRGASGQALQNLNRVLGLSETMGLEQPGMMPM